MLGSGQGSSEWEMRPASRSVHQTERKRSYFHRLVWWKDRAGKWQPASAGDPHDGRRRWKRRSNYAAGRMQTAFTQRRRAPVDAGPRCHGLVHSLASSKKVTNIQTAMYSYSLFVFEIVIHTVPTFIIWTTCCFIWELCAKWDALRSVLLLDKLEL